MSRFPAVLMIGLDAAEPRLIERWTDDGTLPHLARLRERGSYTRLASTARYLAGSVWPSFYTGTWPSEHGLYHHLQWSPQAMAHRRPSPDWLPATPFWRTLCRGGPRVVAFDMPMVYAPEPIHGVEVAGFATHDRLEPPSSSPPELLAEIQREFGERHLEREGGSHRSARSLARLQRELLAATRDATGAAVRLLQREDWDLFLCGFGATHRGGHLLWRFPDDGQRNEADADALPGEALREVYVEVDRSVGELLAAAGPDAIAIAFSLHGMGPNTSRAELVLPQMLARVLAEGRSGERVREQNSRLDGLRRRIPVEWRSSVRRRLPESWRDGLAAFWRTGGVDWSRTRIACQVADAEGYLRINLRGREADGIVEAGAAFEDLCAAVAEGLATFRDSDTGLPVVAEVVRSRDVLPPGRASDLLPDLFVRWSPTPAQTHREISSPRFGAIGWPTPGSNPDGRTGNHREEGFVVAAGDRIASAANHGAEHIIDLAPTVYALFGAPQPEPMCGKPLSILR